MQLFQLIENGDAAGILQGSWTEAELNQRDEHGLTGLMRAAVRGDHAAAQALRSAGADLHLTDPNGRKAVHLAALHGHSVVIAVLIEGGCGG